MARSDHGRQIDLQDGRRTTDEQVWPSSIHAPQVPSDPAEGWRPRPSEPGVGTIPPAAGAHGWCGSSSERDPEESTACRRVPKKVPEWPSLRII
jgi:hypothetical protein